MPFHPTKRCNPNSTQPQSAAKKMSPWCCSMVTYHGIESNSHVIFKETYRPIRIIKDNAWVEIERFSFFQTTPAIWIYRTIPNLLMWLFPVPIRCSLWVAICRWLLGMEVSVWCLSVFYTGQLLQIMIINTNNTKTSKTLKLLWVSSFFFLLPFSWFISANCLNQNFFHFSWQKWPSSRGSGGGGRSSKASTVGFSVLERSIKDWPGENRCHLNKLPWMILGRWWKNMYM